MNTHFEILIDASGSMGFMKGAGEEHENKYLLPDGSTRTCLVKKILIDTLIPKLSFVDSINISTFRNEFTLDKLGKRIIIDKKYKEHPDAKLLYSGDYDNKIINSLISKIKDPPPGATPLFWALSVIINQQEKDDFNIIVLSDGDANDREQFDEEVLKQIKQTNKNCKIYFIGIDQDVEAQKKSKNLANKTNGFYTNLSIINYDDKIFDSLLFNFQTSITTDALKANIKKEHTSPIAKNVTIDTSKNKEEAEETKIISEGNLQDFDLKKQVEVNTRSLKLISNQLDLIVKEMSFIRKENTTEENEFETTENEELNIRIGYECEKYLNSNFLKNNLAKVKWLNQYNEQNKPYDFEIIDNSKNYFIECKGSINDSKEFLLTKTEWQFYLKNRKNYRLYFISEINSKMPKIIKIEDLLVEMEESRLIPCSSINRKVKADRIMFKIL